MKEHGGIEALRSEGEKMLRQLAREDYEAHAGLRDDPDLAGIWRRFAWIPTRATFEAVRAGQEAALLPEQRAGLGRLAEWIARSVQAAASAEIEDRLVATEASLTGIVRDERIGHHALTARVANATDRTLRAELYAALEAQWRSLAPLAADALAAGRDAVRGLGLGEYTDACSTLYGFDLRALARAAEELLARTDDLFRDSVGELARRAGLGVPRRQWALHDLWALLRLRDRDAIFHPADLTRRCLEVVERMGLDPLASGRIRLDLEERPGKRARAFCVGLRIPQEVVVVCRPRGGAADYRTFLHELGHALHRAHTSAALPFEDRALGDASVTEGWATLLDRVGSSAPFIERVLRKSRRDAELPARELATADLLVTRRHAAKLVFEIDLHDGAPDAAERYAAALSRACAVSVGDARWAMDVDPGLYAARYLRAWQLEAAAFEALRERFDEDWFVNPRTGPFLQGLWALGQSRNADEIAGDAFGATLDMPRLVRRFEERLA